MVVTCKVSGRFFFQKAVEYSKTGCGRDLFAFL